MGTSRMCDKLGWQSRPASTWRTHTVKILCFKTSPLHRGYNLPDPLMCSQIIFLAGRPLPPQTCSASWLSLSRYFSLWHAGRHQPSYIEETAGNFQTKVNDSQQTTAGSVCSFLSYLACVGPQFLIVLGKKSGRFATLPFPLGPGQTSN